MAEHEKTELGIFIEMIRTERNISQRQLAELAGISNTEVWRLETGERRKPSPDVLKALAPHLGLRYEDLMIKAGYMEETLEHRNFTETIFRDSQGSVVDIVKRAKEMYTLDSDWANMAYRISKELPPEDIAAIKAIATSLLNKKKK